MPVQTQDFWLKQPFIAFICLCCFSGCNDVPNQYAIINELLSGRGSESERVELIRQLDQIPLDCFSEAYFAAYCDEAPLTSWSLNGFDPTRCPWHETLQLVWAAREGTLQLHNGGLSQLLYNSHGDMLPEISRWYADNGMKEVSGLLTAAADMLKCDIRDRSARIARLQDSDVAKEVNILNDQIEKHLQAEKDFDAICDRSIKALGITRLQRN